MSEGMSGEINTGGLVVNPQTFVTTPSTFDLGTPVGTPTDTSSGNRLPVFTPSAELPALTSDLMADPARPFTLQETRGVTDPSRLTFGPTTLGTPQTTPRTAALTTDDATPGEQPAAVTTTPAETRADAQTPADATSAAPTDQQTPQTTPPGTQTAPAQTSAHPTADKLEGLATIGDGEKGALVTTGLAAIPVVGALVTFGRGLLNLCGFVGSCIKGDPAWNRLARAGIEIAGAAVATVAPLTAPAAVALAEFAVPEAAKQLNGRAQDTADGLRARNLQENQRRS